MNNKRKFTKKDICAVVVTYNPTELLLENIQSISNQVDMCLIVDNGSEDQTFQNKANNEFGAEVKFYKNNKGIAVALNYGLQFCEKHHYSLMLTMDQDTVLSNDCVKKLLKPINEDLADSCGINWDRKAKDNQYVSYLITSGNLIKVDVAKSVKGYDEALFIDSVDFDICLKLLDSGYKMVKVADAEAKHNLGDKNGTSKYRTHTANRYYYISRNHFIIIRKYKKRHVLFCVKKQLAFAWDLINLTLYDKDRNEKYRAIIEGYKDSKKLMIE